MKSKQYPLFYQSPTFMGSSTAVIQRDRQLPAQEARILATPITDIPVAHKQLFVQRITLKKQVQEITHKLFLSYKSQKNAIQSLLCNFICQSNEEWGIASARAGLPPPSHQCGESLCDQG